MSGQGEYSGTKPGHGEVLKAFFDQEIAHTHTMIPGTVTAYDVATNTATVELGFMRVYGDGPAVPYKPLVKVPVWHPRTAGAWVRLPVAAGDTGEVRFAERELDLWLENGGQVDPGYRKFSVSDAVFVPGLTTSGEAIQPKGAASSIEVQNGGTWIEVTAAGKVKVTNGTTDLLAVLNSILNHLQSLTTVGGPTTQTISPATVTQLALDQTNLQSLMP